MIILLLYPNKCIINRVQISMIFHIYIFSVLMEVRSFNNVFSRESIQKSENNLNFMINCKFEEICMFQHIL